MCSGCDIENGPPEPKTPREIKAIFRIDLGYRSSRMDHNGHWCVVYDGYAQGCSDSEDPDSGRWVAVCDDHSSLVEHDTLRSALETMKQGGGLNFCDECREYDDRIKHNRAGPSFETTHRWIKKIQAAATLGDDDVAHNIEITMRDWVLCEIASGKCLDPAELARLATTSSEISFQRWTG